MFRESRIVTLSIVDEREFCSFTSYESSFSSETLANYPNSNSELPSNPEWKDELRIGPKGRTPRPIATTIFDLSTLIVIEDKGDIFSRAKR